MGAEVVMEIAVCGLHLRGQPLAASLQALGATFLREAHSAPVYRLLALRAERWKVAKPGLVRVADGSGAPIYLEILEAAGAECGQLLVADTRTAGEYTISTAGQRP